jgi:hypothetical protein
LISFKCGQSAIVAVLQAMEAGFPQHRNLLEPPGAYGSVASQVWRRPKSRAEPALKKGRKMDLVAKLPSMEGPALAVLRENAERLQHSGTGAQRSAATALLPAIETELANRQAAKLAASAAKRAATKGAAKSAAKGGVKRPD